MTAMPMASAGNERGPVVTLTLALQSRALPVLRAWHPLAVGTYWLDGQSGGTGMLWGQEAAPLASRDLSSFLNAVSSACSVRFCSIRCSSLASTDVGLPRREARSLYE
jgi:hypothetical protein